MYAKDAPGLSVLGAVVTVTAGGRTWSRQIVTGDSFTAQHPPQVHFGLGEGRKWSVLTSAGLMVPLQAWIHLRRKVPFGYAIKPLMFY